METKFITLILCFLLLALHTNPTFQKQARKLLDRASGPTASGEDPNLVDSSSLSTRLLFFIVLSLCATVVGVVFRRRLQNAAVVAAAAAVPTTCNFNIIGSCFSAS